MLKHSSIPVAFATCISLICSSAVSEQRVTAPDKNTADIAEVQLDCLENELKMKGTVEVKLAPLHVTNFTLLNTDEKVTLGFTKQGDADLKFSLGSLQDKTWPFLDIQATFKISKEGTRADPTLLQENGEALADDQVVMPPSRRKLLALTHASENCGLLGRKRILKL
jgi:hypothetical protein